MTRRVIGHLVVGAVLAAAAAAGVLAWVLSHGGPAPAGTLTIEYPFDGAVFPPEIVAPTFRWKGGPAEAGTWRVGVSFADGKAPLEFGVSSPQWRPDANAWATIRKRSAEADARVTVSAGGQSASVAIRTSRDEVGAAIFYREVNLPFIEAVKDPTAIRWRFGAVSSEQRPPIVLEKLPVCGNCHSFSRDGRTLAMDVDYANSKGSYVITRVARQMALATSDIITWNDYRKADGEQTFGLLSQISPDGRVVLSTVKDKSVFVPQPELAFSQLFFPIRGILAYYRRDSRTYHPLPGADDPKYVQSNPAWDPDGQWVVFARAEAYDLRDTRGQGKVLLAREECREFTEEGKPFRFDLYRVPFHDGRGGKPEPLAGASHNGVSNYFPKFSPDGKWIVFCRARSYMLLQPDAELWIIPAEGGEARRLACNTRRMNSWHSFSPNGRWLVFASKAFSDYTQLFLTHIDERGESTPPVLLERFTGPDGAANIPEFVPAAPDAIEKVHEQFLNDYSFVRAGNQFFFQGDTDNALREYERAVKLNPGNVEAHRRMGFLLYHVKARRAEGMAHITEALRLEPADGPANYEMGMALMHQRQFDRAARHLAQAVRVLPDGLDLQYNAADMRFNLGRALLFGGAADQAAEALAAAVKVAPRHAAARYHLALALAALGRLGEAVGQYDEAVRLDPKADRMPGLHDVLAAGYAQAGQFDRAVAHAERGVALARAEGNEPLAARIQAQLEAYRQKRLPAPNGSP
ncbi:MAG TPA: tetratricopeptide repeat protein [Phycisphaerae bacterium]|nr:tetratricopeptide repeat protein [Phycisphaerae bacterium]